MLEYFGDLGGLMEAITVGGSLLMMHVMAYTVDAKLASSIFRARKGKTKSDLTGSGLTKSAVEKNLAEKNLAKL